MASPQVQRTVLVTGATGLLGRQVCKEFSTRGWAVKGTGFSRADGKDILKLDFSEQSAIEKVLDEIKPQVVVHCAANKYPDQVEKNPEGAHELNVAATKSLAQHCAERSTLLIYISTDYVFAGRPGEAPYENDAKVETTTLYGLLKADGETAVLNQFEKVPGSEGLGVVLRVPVLYGDAEMPSESAVNTLMDTVWKSQEMASQQGGDGTTKIKVDHWAQRYPTCTEDVGRVCQDIAVKYLAEGPTNSLPHILQFSSEDKMTKYEICQTFAEIMGLPIDGLEPNTEGNDSGAVARPYDCHLSTKALQDLGINVSTCNFKAWWRREVGAFRK